MGAESIVKGRLIDTVRFESIDLVLLLGLPCHSFPRFSPVHVPRPEDKLPTGEINGTWNMGTWHMAHINRPREVGYDNNKNEQRRRNKRPTAAAAAYFRLLPDSRPT